MEKSILKQLFDGEIYPSEKLCIGTDEYKKINEALTHATDSFEKTLTESNRDNFSMIIDLYKQLASLFSYEGFRSGYKLGIMLLFEALNKE